MSNLTVTREELEQFARDHNLPFSKVEALVRNIYYRTEYRKEYNTRPEVKAKRRERNRREYELQKALKGLGKS